MHLSTTATCTILVSQSTRHWLSRLTAGPCCTAGRLDDELMAVTRRVGQVLRTLPKEVTPVNLEELRRVKQLLVELESKADLLR